MKFEEKIILMAMQDKPVNLSVWSRKVAKELQDGSSAYTIQKIIEKSDRFRIAGNGKSVKYIIWRESEHET